MSKSLKKMAELRRSFEEENRKAAASSKIPDREYFLEPATGIISPEPEIEQQREELAVRHPAARSFPSAVETWD
jgi:hypothetical protein